MEDSLDERRHLATLNATSSGPKVWRRWAVWLLCIGILSAAAYWYFHKPAAAPTRGEQTADKSSSRKAPVVAVPVRNSDIGVELSALGTVTPIYTVSVKSRVDGQITKIHFIEGQSVKAGDLLAEIDPRPFQVQLTQAQGAMARDEALLKNAQVDLQRYRTLFEQDSIAKQQLDTQAALVRQYEGAIKANQGQIDSARLQLAYSKITAPISGRLGLRQVDLGNVVHASDATGLVVITQLQPVTVVFTIPQDRLPDVLRKLSAKETLSVEAFDRDAKNKLATGKLLTVDNQIDPTTGTVKLKAQFANADLALFPNQFVNVRLLLDVKRNAIVIPATGVQRGAQGTFVYVVKDDQSVSVRPVTLGAAQQDTVAIESGLAVGELIVIDGTDKLREGAKVEFAAADRGSASNGEGASSPASTDRGGPQHANEPAKPERPSPDGAGKERLDSGQKREKNSGTQSGHGATESRRSEK